MLRFSKLVCLLLMYLLKVDSRDIVNPANQINLSRHRLPRYVGLEGVGHHDNKGHSVQAHPEGLEKTHHKVADLTDDAKSLSDSLKGLEHDNKDELKAVPSNSNPTSADDHNKQSNVLNKEVSNIGMMLNSLEHEKTAPHSTDKQHPLNSAIAQNNMHEADSVLVKIRQELNQAQEKRKQLMEQAKLEEIKAKKEAEHKKQVIQTLETKTSKLLGNLITKENTELQTLDQAEAELKKHLKIQHDLDRNIAEMKKNISHILNTSKNTKNHQEQLNNAKSQIKNDAAQTLNGLKDDEYSMIHQVEKSKIHTKIVKSHKPVKIMPDKKLLNLNSNSGKIKGELVKKEDGENSDQLEETVKQVQDLNSAVNHIKEKLNTVVEDKDKKGLEHKESVKELNMNVQKIKDKLENDEVKQKVENTDIHQQMDNHEVKDSSQVKDVIKTLDESLEDIEDKLEIKNSDHEQANSGTTMSPKINTVIKDIKQDLNHMKDKLNTKQTAEDANTKPEEKELDEAVEDINENIKDIEEKIEPENDAKETLDNNKLPREKRAMSHQIQSFDLPSTIQKQENKQYAGTGIFVIAVTVLNVVGVMLALVSVIVYKFRTRVDKGLDIEQPIVEVPISASDEVEQDLHTVPSQEPGFSAYSFYQVVMKQKKPQSGIESSLILPESHDCQEEEFNWPQNISNEPHINSDDWE